MVLLRILLYLDVLNLPSKHKSFIGGDDFKSGQTKIKSVLAQFLVEAGIRPLSIVSYNHLGIHIYGTHLIKIRKQ